MGRDFAFGVGLLLGSLITLAFLHVRKVKNNINIPNSEGYKKFVRSQTKLSAQDIEDIIFRGN